MLNKAHSGSTESLVQDNWQEVVKVLKFTNQPLKYPLHKVRRGAVLPPRSAPRATRCSRSLPHACVGGLAVNRSSTRPSGRRPRTASWRSWRSWATSQSSTATTPCTSRCARREVGAAVGACADPADLGPAAAIVFAAEGAAHRTSCSPPSASRSCATRSIARSSSSPPTTDRPSRAFPRQTHTCIVWGVANAGPARSAPASGAPLVGIRCGARGT